MGGGLSAGFWSRHNRGDDAHHRSDGPPFRYADKTLRSAQPGLRVASGLISIAFGLFLVYEIGFVNGLFTSHPQWTPR